MKTSTGHILEWIVPVAFVVCFGWLFWHIPAFILDFAPHENESQFRQVSELHMRKDVTPNLPGLFGGFADIIDWTSLILLPIIFVIGVSTVRLAPMEFQEAGPQDRPTMFLGRIAMLLVLIMTGVMMYEVFMRYVVDRPTLWGNELTLWIAGFVFLVSGLYVMQQRAHIRITLLYDAVPGWLRQTFDVISVVIIWVIVAAMIFGSYSQVFITKFYRWEMFGTAFDPPIPATIQPTILIVFALLAIQALINLIVDWGKEPPDYSETLIDEDELESIKRSTGSV